MSLQQLAQQMNQGPQPGQSIADYCSQMQQASQNSGSVNNGLSSICYSNQSSCTSTCSSLIAKYQTLVNNCDGCEAESVYSSTLSSLQNASGTCQSLRANVSAMAQQGVGSSSGQAYGSICQQQASYNPSSLGGSSPSASANPAAFNNDPYGCAQNPQSQACQDCAVNPNSEACKALQNGQQAQRGKAGFQNAAKKEDGSGFNPAALDDALSATNARLNVAPANTQGFQNQVQAVPNNTGGALPGQAAQSQANLASGKPAAAAQQPASTDIMQGHMAGGYSQGSGFEAIMRNGRGSFRTIAGAAPQSAAKPYVGMDLKKYLPGFDRVRAGLNGRSAEINGKGVDLFKKISNKIEEKCKLGILWECKP